MEKGLGSKASRQRQFILAQGGSTRASFLVCHVEEWTDSVGAGLHPHTSKCDGEFPQQEKVPERLGGETPNSHLYRVHFPRLCKPRNAGVDFSSARGLLDCGPKRHDRELLRRRPHVPTGPRALASGVLRRTIHSSSLLHCVLRRVRFNAGSLDALQHGANLFARRILPGVSQVRAFRHHSVCDHPHDLYLGDLHRRLDERSN
mmetsp:Transcript_1481/g.4036  ORF Transcript_1481/g.4036 Transcript_1481/m.4036 type:complete len:203 (+) Transcript_1481:947-1555(+)